MAWLPRVTCKLAKYFIVLESRRQWTNIVDLLTKQTDPAPPLRRRDSSERKAKQIGLKNICWERNWNLQVHTPGSPNKFSIVKVGFPRGAQAAGRHKDAGKGTRCMSIQNISSVGQ